MKAALSILVAFLVAGCTNFQQRGAPVTSYLEVRSAQGEVLAMFRTDGVHFLVMAAGGAQGGVFDKASGITVFGPIAAAGGKVRLVSKPHNIDADLKPGDPLPSWVLDVGLFRNAEEAAALGFTIAAPTVP